MITLDLFFYSATKTLQLGPEAYTHVNFGELPPEFGSLVNPVIYKEDDLYDVMIQMVIIIFVHQNL